MYYTHFTNILNSLLHYSSDSVNKPVETTDEARYKYHQEIEEAVNKQIIAEFNAAYSYLSLATYFGRTGVGLLGTQKFYMGMFNEENEHAMKLIRYQEMRGAPIKLTSVESIECENCNIQQSLQLSLGMEREITDRLMQLLELARKHEDIATEDFIVSEYIKEQMESIRQLGALLSLAIRMGESGIAEYLLDMKLATTEGH